MSTIKIGLAGWGFRQLTIREYFDAAARLGLPMLELNCRPDVLAHAWVDFSQDDLSEILDCAATGHIEIVALSARNDFTHADPTQLNSQAAQLRRIIESAAYLKARFVRVLIGQDPVQDTRVDFPYTKQKLGGKICLWGGVNGFVTVEQGTPDDVKTAVEHAIDVLSPNGGFILSPVDNVATDSEQTWQNVRVFLDTWKANREY